MYNIQEAVKILLDWKVDLGSTENVGREVEISDWRPSADQVMAWGLGAPVI